jgi:DNA-binding response OmpR family regulator
MYTIVQVSNTQDAKLHFNSPFYRVTNLCEPEVEDRANTGDKLDKADAILISTEDFSKSMGLCQFFRSSGIEVPILLLCQDPTEGCIVESLRAGADDVVSSEFKEVIEAKVKSFLRRPPIFIRECMQAGDLFVNVRTREVRRNGKLINLTNKEYQLLVILLRNKNHTVRRDRLYSKIWGNDSESYLNIVDVYIRYLRRKIDDDYDHKLLKSVYGVGYMLTDAD